MNNTTFLLFYQIKNTLFKIDIFLDTLVLIYDVYISFFLFYGGPNTPSFKSDCYQGPTMSYTRTQSQFFAHIKKKCTHKFQMRSLDCKHFQIKILQVSTLQKEKELVKVSS